MPVLRVVAALIALLTAACAPAAPPSPTAARQAPPAAVPTVAPAQKEAAPLSAAPSKPAASPTTAVAPLPTSTPVLAGKPTVGPLAPTSSPARKQTAEVEFVWGNMDPMMMEHDDGTMARQAEGIPGVVQAVVSDSGITIQYDAQVTTAAQIRTALIRFGMSLKD